MTGQPSGWGSRFYSGAGPLVSPLAPVLVCSPSISNGYNTSDPNHDSLAPPLKVEANVLGQQSSLRIDIYLHNCQSQKI